MFSPLPASQGCRAKLGIGADHSAHRRWTKSAWRTNKPAPLSRFCFCFSRVLSSGSTRFANPMTCPPGNSYPAGPLASVRWRRQHPILTQYALLRSLQALPLLRESSVGSWIRRVCARLSRWRVEVDFSFGSHSFLFAHHRCLVYDRDCARERKPIRAWQRANLFVW